MSDRNLQWARGAGVMLVLAVYVSAGWHLTQSRPARAEAGKPAPVIMVSMVQNASKVLASAPGAQPAQAVDSAPAISATDPPEPAPDIAPTPIRRGVPQVKSAASATTPSQPRLRTSGVALAPKESDERSSKIAGDGVAQAGDAASASPDLSAARGEDVVISQPAYDGQPPKPDYPAQALRARQQGLVLIRVRIEKDGSVQRAEVRVSSGFASLDAAALRAAMRTRFRPYLRDGVARSALADLPFNFVVRP